MDGAISIWHTSLCALALLNVGAWTYTATRFADIGIALPGDVRATRRALLWLSAVYVAGCAFRSLMPMLDEPRICLHDTPLSRVAIGRTVATVAEMAFVVQWALLLNEAAGATRHPIVRQVAYLVLPLVVLAETFSWLAVLTKNNLLHALENSVWTLGGALVLAAFVAMHEDARRGRKRALVASIVAICAYLAFMVTVDIPMYLQRWYADGSSTVSVAVGLGQIIARCTLTYSLVAWRDDIVWLTLYFSTAVWLSIALVYTPPLHEAYRGRHGDRTPFVEVDEMH